MALLSMSGGRFARDASSAGLLIGEKRNFSS